jgi:hypothetical protein
MQITDRVKKCSEGHEIQISGDSIFLLHHFRINSAEKQTLQIKIPGVAQDYHF